MPGPALKIGSGRPAGGGPIDAIDGGLLTLFFMASLFTPGTF
ncbi:hypothetical protein [Arthrobacter mobilis]|nr:hypothetical protein [Arthrobacter mobilis]